MHIRFEKSLRPRTHLAVAALLCATSCVFGQAQMESELDEGLRYVQGLQRLFFMDIADKVLAELTQKYPEAEARAATLQLQGDLVRGKFGEVMKRISEEEKRKGADSDTVWAMKLALADSYFTYGKNEECRVIYDAFFKKFGKEKTDPKTKKTSIDVPAALETMFTDAAYKYAQMLLNMKDRPSALTMYKLVRSTNKLPQHVARQCMAEEAEIGLALAEETNNNEQRATYCKDVNFLCDKLLWVQDLWFGKAIVLKAHVLMIENKPEDAKLLVDRYMGTLTAIHMALVEQEKESGEPLTRVSPMAECRYLLAVMLQDKADKIMSEEGFNKNDPKMRESVLSLLLGSKDINTGKRKGDGAYNHFVNVYLKYPESNWAADAGDHSEQVREWLVNVFDGKVESKVTPEQTARVRAIQYRDARTVFAQGQVETAKTRLSQVLNSFPDCVESVSALGDLARCYIQEIASSENAQLYAETIIGHLAERFCERPDTMNLAGDELIRVAEYWKEYGRDDLRLDTYAKFFKLYPKHPSCVSYLTSFGEKAFQDKDYPHALEFYGIVADSYTNSPRAFDALSRIASIHEEASAYDKLLPVLDDLIKRLGELPKPTQQLYSSRYRKASALRSMAVDTLKSEDITNEVVLAKAKKSLTMAIKEFDTLITDLKTPPPSAEVDQREKDMNTQIREISLFNKAISLTQLPWSNEKQTSAAREMAVKVYEELIADYPKGAIAPTALIQIGSIYAMEQNAEKADDALSRLRKEYPESEQAKSALPLMADNLMKLGMREQAVSRYREMFSSAGTDYADSDILRGVRALIDAKEFDLAKIGLERLLKDAKDESDYQRAGTLFHEIGITPNPAKKKPLEDELKKIASGIAKENVKFSNARFAEAQIFMGSKDYNGAVTKLQNFVGYYSGLATVIDAYLLLSQASSEAGLVEKDNDHRFDLFNISLSAMKEVKKRRTNDLEVAQCDIETGRIMSRKATSEAQFGDKNKAAEYRGKALISYQVFIDSIRPNDVLRLPLVEVAFYECVPLLIAHGQWDLVSDNCNDYLRRFPKGKFASQFNAWKNQAKIELGDTGDAPASSPNNPPTQEPSKPVEE